MKLTLTLTDGNSQSKIGLIGDFNATSVAAKVTALNSLSSGYVVDHDLLDDVDVDLTIPVTTAASDSTPRKNVRVLFNDGTSIRIPGDLPTDMTTFIEAVPASITNENGDTLTVSSVQYSN